MKPHSTKDSGKRMKRRAQAREEKISVEHLSDKGLASKMSKELLKLNKKKTDNPMKNGQKDLNTHH